MSYSNQIHTSPRFTFIYSDGTDRVEKEFEHAWLPSVIERFEEFLRGCGYHFDNIEIVDSSSSKESNDWESSDEDEEKEERHSSYYEKDRNRPVGKSE